MRPTGTHLPLLCLVVLASCAPSSAAPAGPSTRTTQTQVQSDRNLYAFETTTRPNTETVAVTASRTSTWEAMAASFQAAGLEVTAADPAAGTLQVTRQRVRSRLGDRSVGEYFDCGSSPAGPLTRTYTLHVSVRGQISAQGEAFLVQTTAEATANDPATNNPAVTCATRGTLERRISEGVRQRAS